MVDLAPRPLSAASVWEGALVLGATMRLTRLVVSDDIGNWWIKAPIGEAIVKHTENGPSRTRAMNYWDGLNCPWCVGYWIGGGVLAVTAATRGTRLQRPWRFVMASLALNAVVVPAGRAVDYWSGGEE